MWSTRCETRTWFSSKTFSIPVSHLAFLKRLLLGHQPRRFCVAVLLDKPSRRKLAINADYVGFTIADEFVVGYGLDYAEKYRNLPDIRVLPGVSGAGSVSFESLVVGKSP